MFKTIQFVNNFVSPNFENAKDLKQLKKTRECQLIYKTFHALKIKKT
jgi:hypothetical protein